MAPHTILIECPAGDPEGLLSIEPIGGRVPTANVARCPTCGRAWFGLPMLPPVGGEISDHETACSVWTRKTRALALVHSGKVLGLGVARLAPHFDPDGWGLPRAWPTITERWVRVQVYSGQSFAVATPSWFNVYAQTREAVRLALAYAMASEFCWRHPTYTLHVLDADGQPITSTTEEGV